jgi:hypothetical protein
MWNRHFSLPFPMHLSAERLFFEREDGRFDFLGNQ